MFHEISTKEFWDSLVDSGGYSIGYFAITTHKELVRVYHYRTKTVSYFPRESSFEGMQQLCHTQGMELGMLLDRHIPKSFRSLQKFNQLTQDNTQSVS